MLDKTNKQIKSIMKQVGKVVCNQADFHIQIPVNDPKDAPMKQRQIELCQNAQVSLKISLKESVAPLKMKIDYLDLNMRAKMNKKQKMQLKNNLDIYLSKTNPNPLPNAPGDAKKRNELNFCKVEPPSSITIFADERNTQGMAFKDEYLYITLDCKDSEILDETIFEIKAVAQRNFIQQITKRQKKSKGASRSRTAEFDDEPDQTLDQFYESSSRKQKAHQNSLLQFKRNISKQVNGMLDDEAEYNDFMRGLKQRRSVGGRRQVGDAVFLTQSQELQDISEFKIENQSPADQDSFSPDLSSSPTRFPGSPGYRAMANDILMNQIVSTGDFIQHNRLSVQLADHGKFSKQVKQIAMNNEYNRKKALYAEKKEQLECLDHKKKYFLIHRQSILKQKRQEMTEHKLEEQMKVKRIRRLITLMTIPQIIRDHLLVNFQELRQTKRQKFREFRCSLRICLTLKFYHSRRGTDLDERYRKLIRNGLTLLAQSHSAWQENSDYTRESSRSKVFNFLKGMKEIDDLILKIKRYSCAVSNIQKIYTRFIGIRRERLAIIKRLWDEQKQKDQTLLFKLSHKNPKSKEKYAKFQLLNENSREDMSESHYQLQKLKWEINDRLSLNQKYEKIANDCWNQLEEIGNAPSTSQADTNEVDNSRLISNLEDKVKYYRAGSLTLQEKIYRKYLQYQNLQTKLGMNKKKHFTETIDVEEHILGQLYNLEHDAKLARHRPEGWAQKRDKGAKRATLKGAKTKALKPIAYSLEEALGQKIGQIQAEFMQEGEQVNVLRWAPQKQAMKKLIEQGIVIAEYEKNERELALQLDADLSREARGGKGRKNKKEAAPGEGEGDSDDDKAIKKPKKAKTNKSKEKDNANNNNNSKV